MNSIVKSRGILPICRWGVRLAQRSLVICALGAGTVDAQISSSGCGGGDFGGDCSLFELTQSDAAWIQVGETRFGYFANNDFGNPDIDTHMVRVTGLDDISNQPGLRFEPIPGTVSVDASDTPDPGEFVRALNINFTAETAPGEEPLDFTAMSLTTETLIDYDGLSAFPDFRGGCTGGLLYAHPVSTDHFLLDPPRIAEGGYLEPSTCGDGTSQLGPIRLSYTLPNINRLAGAVGAQAVVFAKHEQLLTPEPFNGVGEVIWADIRVGISGTEPPPDFSDHVDNPTFSPNLDPWTPGGTNQTIDLDGLGVVEMSIPGDPGDIATLGQGIDTPNESFEFALDYQFLTTSGVLQVKLNGVEVGAVIAPPSLTGVFERERILVNDPSLMGLTNAPVSLELIPGSPAAVEIAHFGVMSFLVPAPIARANARVCDDLGQFCSNDPFIGTFEEDPVQVSTRRKLPVSAVNFVECRAKSEVNPFTGGIVGSECTVEDAIFEDFISPGGGARAVAVSNYQVVYTGVGPPPTIPVDVDVALNVTGSIEVGTRDYSRAEVKAVTQIHGIYGQCWLFWGELVYEKRAGYFPLVVSPHTRRDSACGGTGGRFGWGPDDPEEKGTIIDDNEPDIEEIPPDNIPDGNAISVTTNRFFENAYHVPVGSVLALEFGLTTKGFSIDTGQQIIDFFDTMEAELDSDTPGIEIIPIRTFAINAGLNDAWFNPATAGQGFFIIVFPDIPLIFLAWFTYDTERPDEDVAATLGEAGHRWVTAQGGFSGDTAMLDVFQTTGGVFDSAEPAPEPAVKIGTMKIIWADCKNAILTYDIPDLELMGEVPLQRIALDNVALCEALSEE